MVIGSGVRSPLPLLFFFFLLLYREWDDEVGSDSSADLLRVPVLMVRFVADTDEKDAAADADDTDPVIDGDRSILSQ